jgi:hypothetical protein
LIQDTEDSNDREFLEQVNFEAIRNRSAMFRSYWIVSNSNEESDADVGLTSDSDEENVDTDTRHKDYQKTLLVVSVKIVDEIENAHSDSIDQSFSQFCCLRQMFVRRLDFPFTNINIEILVVAAIHIWQSDRTGP